MKPERVTLSRARGWKMPPNTIKVDRSTIFGNPWRIKGDVTAFGAVQYFSEWLDGLHPSIEPRRRDTLLMNLFRLKGKNAACWCKPGDPCHAIVLMRKARAL